MRAAVILATTLTAVACAGSRAPHEAGPIDEYVAVNRPAEVDWVRVTRPAAYHPVSERFLIVSARNGDFLAEFRSACRDFGDPESGRHWTSDMIDRRSSMNILRAGGDTIRGCVISNLYEISDAQREELLALVDAPDDAIKGEQP